MRQEHIYRVNFDEPPISGDQRCDFYFFSLAAIYELFTPQEIGCGLRRLWAVGLRRGTVYENRHRTVRITREEVARMRRKPPMVE